MLNKAMRYSCAIVVACCTLFSSCIVQEHTSSQTADSLWTPSVANPEFQQGTGPIVLIDAAHGNFHTIDGRFSAFAQLLRLDGYQIESSESIVNADLLERASVFVISNAILGGDDAEWALPAPSAFTADEITALVGWVESGGSLLLLADHMPFPGATAELASEFGIIFLNGFALKSATEGGTMSFTRASGSLADHVITSGRNDTESIESIRSFTGQAFRFVSAVQPLMFMPDEWEVLLPIEAWEFSEATPTVSARGLIQGGVLEHGQGRVAVFGEAAMFTAQSSVSDGVARQVGMNHPAATENAQFILNVMHWLTGQMVGQANEL